MKQKTHKPCNVCGKEFKLSRTTDRYCTSECMHSDKKEKPLKPFKSINKVSKKQSILNAKYTVLRIEFLGHPDNQFCFIEGCNKKADTIEHTRGRKGYFDDWARENNIPLIIDVRFFKACCLFHNLELENNSELSKQYQLSKLHSGKKL